ncbi:MAG: MATE family efflux transporter [Clostridia bacterium]|nr:MATE family efflux transporter [Clostridia bacterium]
MSGYKNIPEYRLTRRDVRFFLAIMLPALVELLLSQIFGMIDTVMLGRLPDSAVVLAAVGITASPINLVVCVVTAFCIGTTATVAIATGAGKQEEARSAARQSLMLLCLVGAVLTVFCMAFAESIIRFAGAKDEIFADAVSYYRYIAAGFFFQSVTISITAALRGVGITRIPLFYNLSAAALNVVLNYIMIYGKLGLPAMGVTGAALATTVSKGVAFLAALLFLFFGNLPVGIRRGDSFRPDLPILKRILKIGITSGMEQVILQSGAVLSTRIMAVLPTADFAAYQIAANVEGIAWQPGSACCTASTTCMGQAIGEGRPDKAKAMVRMIFITSVAMGLGMFALFLFCGRPIAAIYTEDGQVVQTAARILAYCSAAMPAVSIHQTIAGALRGAGDTRTPMIASLCSLWIFRVALSWLLISRMGMGIIAMRVCITLDQFVRASINLIRYRQGKWVGAAEKLR